MASNVFTNVHPDFQPEEAAHAAFEFVSSLDNLPGEVTFLLQEIADKETKMNSLRLRINTRHYGLTKNLKNVNSSSSGTTTPTTLTLPIPTGQPLPVGHLSTKDQQSLQKIQAEWSKVEQLQMEKIRLATRLEQIVSRARERGKAEWKKVGGMDLEEIESKEGKPAFGELGGGEVLLPSSGLGSGTDRPIKKRKPNAIAVPAAMGSPIIHPPGSSMLPPPAPRPSLSARGSSRHNRHVSTSTLSEDMEVDAEAEYDNGEADGDTDQSIYCYCQQKSYGEMIGCDNDNCEFEWFHVKCVGMADGPAPDIWYCPSCVQMLGLASSSGGRGDKRSARGRKK